MTTLSELEVRVVALEERQAVLDAAISLARWLGPILVGVAAIIVSVALR